MREPKPVLCPGVRRAGLPSADCLLPDAHRNGQFPLRFDSCLEAELQETMAKVGRPRIIGRTHVMCAKQEEHSL